MTADAHATIAHHSKSFALASRLLPAAIADDAVVLYAYCRRADDAIDLAPSAEHAARLGDLRREVNAVYAGDTLDDALLAVFQQVVLRRRIPRAYLDELVEGMQMDACGVRYQTWEDLSCYCYRVAGTVGLMMCHVMGVRRAEALVHAAHLGMAMQLTNIARDVLEDWRRGRLYLPDEVLSASGAPDLRARLGERFPGVAASAVARATAAVLERADAYYRSGDAGLRYLSPRCGFAVRTARRVYSRIGDEVRAQGCDPLAGRAIVSTRRKLLAAGRAALATVLSPAALVGSRPFVPAVSLEHAGRVPPP
jgi:15-cis-phytoene synthase